MTLPFDGKCQLLPHQRVIFSLSIVFMNKRQLYLGKHFKRFPNITCQLLLSKIRNEQFQISKKFPCSSKNCSTSNTLILRRSNYCAAMVL
ncbi:hypothetical protein T10_8449 [Trichinella papuae]|uniref:Uncharacterized protein n=1 Tax=Trichinella papuae TaxID=268474 RepID=A0A0V1MI46_9BILA|nr:hypothetical protein T10_8449 [Trichinella papuae]